MAGTRRAAAALALCLLCGCTTAQDAAAPATTVIPTPTPTAPARDTETLLEQMTLREKVGQLFFVRPDALDPTQTPEQIEDPDAAGVTALTPSMEEMLAQYPVGGVVLFGKNLTDPDQLTDFSAALRSAGRVPLLLSVDEEGGAVARLAGNDAFHLPTYESAAAVGAQGTQAVTGMSATIGGYLAGFGIGLDFAPVADVNTNPDNPVIGSRAFSQDPNLAAAAVAAAVEGFHSAGVACTLKHFPGHGDTAADSHDGAVTTLKNWEELRDCELQPFVAGIAAGADAVMAGHINTPNATDDGLPASLSHTMLTDRLRGELGFDGVILTDSLSMGAITDRYTPGEAALLALDAGADILLMPEDLAQAFEAVETAVETGRLEESRLDQSVARILQLKTRCGLLEEGGSDANR